VRTEAQAHAAARQIRRQNADPDEVARRLIGFETLSDVIDDFLVDKGAKRERWTVVSYAKHLRSFLARVDGSKPIGEVNEATIEAHLRARVAEDGIQKGTANKELVTLRVLWAWAVKRRLARENPALLVEPYSVRPVARTPPTLALVNEALVELRRAGAPAWTRDGKSRTRKERPDEIHARLLYADLLELCSWTALRSGEVARLERSDIDLEAATAKIRSASNKGPRVLPLVGAALEIVRRRLALGRATVFATHDGAPAGGALNLFGRAWRAAAPRFALVTPHGVRHLVADRLRAAKVNPIIAARILGHRTIQMHAHYSHEDEAEMREGLSRLAPSPARAPAPSARRPRPGRR
jgi:integrase